MTTILLYWISLMDWMRLYSFEVFVASLGSILFLLFELIIGDAQSTLHFAYERAYNKRKLGNAEC
jgi:hypothetical protein